MRILVASHLEQSALRQLQQRHDVICTFDQPTADLSSLAHDREVLVFRSGVEITRALIDCAPVLKLLVRAGCGLDNLDCEYVRKREIVLRRIPEPAAQAVAEMALALMFALAARFGSPPRDCLINFELPVFQNNNKESNGRYGRTGDCSATRVGKPSHHEIERNYPAQTWA